MGWGLADQAASSITNFIVGIVVARSLGASAFGIFSLAWVTYGVVLNISRGLATDPLVVRFSGVTTACWRSAVSKTSGVALVVGLIAGGVCALAGALIGGALGMVFVVLGFVLPGLILQDSWRYAFFAAGVGGRAFMNDMVWAVTLIPAMMIAATDGSVLRFVLAWGASGTVAAAYGYIQSRIMPQPKAVLAWLKQQRDLAPRYLAENVSVSGATQLRIYGLGAIAGLADVGTVRGVELSFGPFLTVLMGIGLAAVPEAARVLRRSVRRLIPFCLLLGGAQAAAALCWGLALQFLMPERFGEYVLGHVWVTASALVLPMTLTVMLVSFSYGAAVGLRALGAARQSLRAQLITSAAIVGLGLAGAAVAGALGSTWGFAFASLLGAVTWWSIGLREFRAAPVTESTGSHAATMR
jgi:O-antigen/teichoic acid export membrane protein